MFRCHHDLLRTAGRRSTKPALRSLVDRVVGHDNPIIGDTDSLTSLCMYIDVSYYLVFEETLLD
jgi:hypothetical protein